MSYQEYWDLYYSAQKKQCPYRAFTFDVKNSKIEQEYILHREKYFCLIEYIYQKLEVEEIKTHKKILLKDRLNQKYSSHKTTNNNHLNPMIIGDMFTFFVYENSISKNRIIDIFISGLKKFNIAYDFHFATGCYETNEYVFGNKFLYKGYMPQLLESLSKNNDLLITLNGRSADALSDC